MRQREVCGNTDLDVRENLSQTHFYTKNFTHGGAFFGKVPSAFSEKALYFCMRQWYNIKVMGAEIEI